MPEEPYDPVKDNLLGKFFLLVFGLASIGGLVYGVSHSNLSALWANVQVATTVTAPASTLEDGLVGHWTFDGPDMDWASTTAEVKDVSGGGNHGDATMGMTSSAATGGQIGSALVFPGAILIGSPVELTNIDSFTYSAWFDVDGVPQNSHGFILSKTSGSGEDIVLEYSTNVFNNYTLRSMVNFDSTDASAISQNLYSAIGIGDGTDAGWHHVIMVYDDITKRISLYLNGTEVSYQTRVDGVSTRMDDSNTDFYIGNNNYGQRDFVGKLDDIRIYNRVLSADEIMQLYKKGEGTKISTTPTLPANDSLNQGLVGHWTFDGPDVKWGDITTEIKDISGNNYHADATSTVSSVKSVTRGVLGQALKFDSTSINKPVLRLQPTNFSFGSSTDLSVSFWFLNKSINSSSYLIDHEGWKGSLVRNSGFSCWYQGNSGLRKINCDFTGDEIGGVDTQNTIFSEENVWYHVTLVVDRSANAQMYVDGEANGSAVDISSLGDISQTFLFIGGGEAGGNEDWNVNSNNGNFFLDDLRIYNRVLSTEEIVRLYQMGEGTKISTTIKTPGSPLEQGLVGHWTFDGPDVEWSSTTAEIEDVSGNGNHGDAMGGMNNRSPAIGKVGQGMSFDGVDDYINIGSDSMYDDMGPMTISAWIKPESWGAVGYGHIMDKSAGQGDGGWTFTIRDSNDDLFFNVSYQTGNASQEGNASGIKLHEWQHVVAVWDGTASGSFGIKLYINSADVTGGGDTTGSGDRESDVSRNLSISDDETQRKFDGDMDDIRLYNRALSADEVQQLYQLSR
jgi:hypothetical protein